MTYCDQIVADMERVRELAGHLIPCLSPVNRGWVPVGERVASFVPEMQVVLGRLARAFGATDCGTQEAGE